MGCGQERNPLVFTSAQERMRCTVHGYVFSFRGTEVGETICKQRLMSSERTFFMPSLFAENKAQTKMDPSWQTCSSNSDSNFAYLNPSDEIGQMF